MVTHKWRWVGIFNTNLPLMKRNIYHPANGCSCGLHTWPTLLQSVCNYTPNGYTVPAKFGAHFLPCMKNDQKRTKMHLNEDGLTSTEFCKNQIQLRQPPIS